MPQPQQSTLGTDQFDAMSTYVKDYKDAFAAAQRLELPSASQLDHVVMTGMGGSGIGASLVEGLCRETSPVALHVLKDYSLPKFVTGKSLVIATSYSGDTEETLFSVADAKDRGAKIAGITSGGGLAKFLESKKLPLHKVPSGRQPRAALPLLFGALAGMLDKVGAAKLGLETRDENQLMNRQVRVQPKLMGVDNDALKIAETLRHAQPAIYGEGFLAPVATRWKCQFNENSKIFARAETLPEANHNDLVAWGMGKPNAADHLVLLRRSTETGVARARFEFLQESARKAGAPVMNLQSQCRTPVGIALDHLMLGDHASVYLAVLHGVDPTPVPVITELKKRLEKDGLASQARKRLEL